MTSEGDEVVNIVDNDEVWSKVSDGLYYQVNDKATAIVERSEAVEAHHAEVVASDVAVVLEFVHKSSDRMDGID